MNAVEAVQMIDYAVSRLNVSRDVHASLERVIRMGAAIVSGEVESLAAQIAMRDAEISRLQNVEQALRAGNEEMQRVEKRRQLGKGGSA